MSAATGEQDNGAESLALPPGVAQFLADLAHQLRNPAFAISASVEALQAETDPPTSSVFLETIQSEAAKLGRLANDIQAYVEPLRMSQSDAAADDLVSAAREQVCPLAEARNVRLLRGEQRVSGPSHCDASALVRAMAALIEHAVLRSRAGSAVSIELADRRDTAGGSLVLTIMDEGQAYSQGALPMVLKPFVTRGGGATGLGLAIAARIAQGHGGRVEIENAPDGGGVARLILPSGQEPS